MMGKEEGGRGRYASVGGTYVLVNNSFGVYDMEKVKDLFYCIDVAWGQRLYEASQPFDSVGFF